MQYPKPKYMERWSSMLGGMKNVLIPEAHLQHDYYYEWNANIGGLIYMRYIEPLQEICT
jgi:hypothetical protein